MENTKKLEWDRTGEHLFEIGVDHGVLYVMSGTAYGIGVAWNGLTAVTESPSGADNSDLYADNIKYLTLRSAEDFGGTIECYTYPDEWMECDGSYMPVKGVAIGQQTRKNFGFSYRTKVGNDTEGEDFGYKLHLVYNASAGVSDRSYNTVNDSPDAITFSYEFTTIPVNVTGHKPTSVVTIDSTKLDENGLAALAILEAILYGFDNMDDVDVKADADHVILKKYAGVTEGGCDPKLLLPDDVIALFSETFAA